MRKKVVKIFIAVFIVMMCAFVAIGAKYYVKAVQSFKTFEIIDKAKLVNMQNDCYNELKKSLDEKYTKKFVELINLTKNDLQDKIESVLGVEYLLIKEEFNTVSSSIEGKKREFTKSEEYIDAKNNLSKLNEKINNLSEEDKNLYLDEYRDALSKISTLNNKLNNQLKPERERVEELKDSLKKLFFKRKKELLSGRFSIMKQTYGSVKELLDSYNLELNELKTNFGVEIGKKEFPFDINTLNDCLVAGKLETECFNEILASEEETTAVFLKNDCNIIS